MSSPSRTLIELEELGAGAPLLSVEERARVLSATRIRFTLTLFVVGVLLGLSAMIFSGVTRIFDWLTPSIRQDLSHKALHGALELAQTAQLGMVVNDTEVVRRASEEYARDPDVVGLAITGSDRTLIYRKGAQAGVLARLDVQEPNHVYDLGTAYGSWSPSIIEGAEVGRVAVVVSKARLAAGMSLRREVLWAAAIGCCVALLACLVFVSLYIGPILRMTGATLERLEKTTEAALAATRLKSHFLAYMSHEFRTPMNGIIGVLELLNRTSLSGKQQRYTQTIETSARGLLTIINDVLDFSKLEAGKYEIRFDDFEVTQLVQEATELLSPKAHAKHLELLARCDADVPERVRGDVDRIKQVLINLLGNAIKFTERGYVELRVSIASRDDAHTLLRFAVRDTGAGIRTEDQSKLFGMFSQVDGSLTRKHGGTGLGLAICKRIVEAMGGEIGVNSEFGAGSEFWFTALVGRAEHMSEVVETPPRHATVLLVSELEAQRNMLAELIQRWGMRCVGADNAERARELLLSQSEELTVAVIDAGIDNIPPAYSELMDLCVVEGLSVIRLLSTNQVASDAAVPQLQSFLWKPVRASELYNAILQVLDGYHPQAHRRVHGSIPSEPLGGHGRVLVVDDNEINRIVAVELVTELGYRADTASDGREAVEKVKNGEFHVVLMDCQMPEVDGFQATELIRQLPGEKAKTPIIALTAHAMVDDRDRVMRAGMDDYASKPVRGRVLAALLRRWVPANAMVSMPPLPSAAPPEASPRALSNAPSMDLESAPLLDPTLPRSQRTLELFLKTVPELVRALSDAVEVADTQRVKQLSHKLKGNCLSLGAHRMAAACHAVEAAALQGRVDVPANQRIAPQLSLVTPLLQQLLVPRPSNDNEAGV
jgi:signal transduction histidine kinase/CheY-like chemotaxis protein/HPt (histidine-containing phosphotransfer) domain-containing protein